MFQTGLSPIRIQPIIQPKSYQYQYIKDLGSGAYSQVKMVQDRNNQQYYAMKIISKLNICKNNAEENINREIELQSKLDNKYILKIIETFEDHQNLYIILEYCNSGNLFDVFKKKSKLTEKEAFPYFYQICLGIDHLHKNNIAHRDIKPDNILVHNKYIKICDFNWAIQLEPNQKTDGVLCGTTEYMPPEVVMKQKHDKGIDIWSLGILLYYFLHGKIPFKGNTQEERIQSILTTTFQVDRQLSVQVQILIYQLLNRSPQQRITIQEVFQTNWMKNYIKEFNCRNPYSDFKLNLNNLQNRQINFNSQILNSQNSCSSLQTNHTFQNKTSVQFFSDKKQSRLIRSMSKEIKSVPIRAVNVSAFGSSDTKRSKQQEQSFFPQK